MTFKQGDLVACRKAGELGIVMVAPKRIALQQGFYLPFMTTFYRTVMTVYTGEFILKIPGGPSPLIHSMARVYPKDWVLIERGFECT